MAKILIVYVSERGSTRKIADVIAEGARSADENLRPVGLSDDSLVAAHHHGVHIARTSAALKDNRIFEH